jgi:flagellar assembly protein FliH
MSFKARCLAEGDVAPFAWQALAGIPEARPAVRQAEHDLEERAATIERDAFAKGYAEGERAGMQAAATRTDAMLRRLAQTIDELVGLRAEIVRKSERQTVQLVLAIAERIVQREITLYRGLVIGMARAALDRLGEHGSATIRLNPADLAAIGDTVDLLGMGVQVCADPVVSRGGCLVQSDFGFMDVSPDAQFRELARQLLADEGSNGDSTPARSVVLR